MLVAARTQSASGEAQRVFARLDSGQEFLQRMRTAYVWISAWPAATIVHHLLVLAVFVAAFVRIRRTVGVELRVLLLGLAALGLLTMPLSWLLLEQFHWGLVPQVQPMRALLFLTLGMQFFTAAAGALRDGRAPSRRSLRLVRLRLPAAAATVAHRTLRLEPRRPGDRAGRGHRARRNSLGARGCLGCFFRDSGCWAAW